MVMMLARALLRKSDFPCRRCRYYPLSTFDNGDRSFTVKWLDHGHLNFSTTTTNNKPIKKVMVVGAGAIGLRTALELIQRDVEVVLRAPIHPLHTSNCSVGAGGLWMPFHVTDQRVNKWAKQTLDELLQYEKQDKNLVEIVPAIALKRNHSGPAVDDFHEHYESKPGMNTIVNEKLPEWTTDPRIKFQHLTIEMLCWQNNIHKMKIPSEQELKDSGYLHAWFFYPPIVNSPNMLTYMLNEIINSSNSDVNVETGIEYKSIEHICDDAMKLQCDAIVNCTGLGAAKLCNDNNMIGARGILHIYDRNTCQRRENVHTNQYGEENSNDAVIMVEEHPWGSETKPCYLIPRGDIIVIGGTYLEGDNEISIRIDENERLLLNAQRMGIDTTKTKPINEWTGFRPYRTQVRCELGMTTKNNGIIKVFHSYGYGGSGWTVNVGAAIECANILLGEEKS